MSNLILILLCLYLPFQLRLPQVPVVNTVNLFLILLVPIYVSNRSRSNVRTDFDKPLLLFLLIWFLSFLHTAVNPDDLELAEVFTDFKRLFSLPLIYFVVAATPRDKKDIDRLFGAFCVTLTLVGFYTFWHGVLGGMNFNDNKRSSGPFAVFDDWTASDIAGGFLATFIPFLLAVAIADKRGTRKILAALATFVCLLGLFATYSRGSILALMLGSGAILAVLSLRRPKYLAVSAGLIVVMAATSQWWLPESIVTRVTQSVVTDSYEGASLDESSQMRMTKWQAGLDRFMDNWLVGMGFDKSRDDIRGKRVDLHNAYLVIAAETGVLGIGLFVYFLYKLFKEALFLVKTEYSVLGLGLVGSLVAFTIVNMFYANFFRDTVVGSFWFILGLGASAISLHRTCLGSTVLIQCELQPESWGTAG